MHHERHSPTTAESIPSTASADRTKSAVAVALIVGAAFVCYGGTLHQPYLFDSYDFIFNNPAVRRLWPPDGWLGFAPSRPLGVLSFALNHAVGGYDVVGYHVVNILIHAACGCVLFGIVRRTLSAPAVAASCRAHAFGSALTSALVWTVHPLASQGVAYLFQRIEALAALGCGASLYAFIRAVAPGSRRGAWFFACRSALLAATLTKETALMWPIVVICYDRIFTTGTWSGVFARRRFHAALVVCCLPTLVLTAVSLEAIRSAGILSVEGVSSWDYLRSQAGVLLHYLRLLVWPAGQCVDYGWPIARSWTDYVPQGIVVTAMAAVTAIGVVRGRAWSFPLAVFFLYLAPTSSVMPIIDLAFEHRMYLPSAALTSLLVCAAVECLRRAEARFGGAAGATSGPSTHSLRRAAVVAAAVISALGATTIARTRVYDSRLVFWSDVVMKAPANARGHEELGSAYFEAGDRRRALEKWRTALEYDPRLRTSNLNVAQDELRAGRTAQAAACLARSRRNRPFDIEYLMTLALVRDAEGNTEEADQALRTALLHEPRHGPALDQRGRLMQRLGRNREAAALYLQAAHAMPDAASPRNNLGVLLCLHGRFAEAVPWFEEALRLDPDNAEAANNLARARRESAK